MDHQNNCLLCGQPLVYYQELRPLTCSLCGKTFEANAHCKDGHYICDHCHGKDSLALITELCLKSPATDPIRLAQEIMAFPQIHMHGPEHHVLVGAVLLTAYRYSGGEIDLESALAEMVKRGQKVPGGFCGYYGACGAALSTGIFISIITGATPLSAEPWQAANRMTAWALTLIADYGGPRCCKRDSFLALQAAIDFTAELTGVEMVTHEPVRCSFFSHNKQCRREACPFFPGA